MCVSGASTGVLCVCEGEGAAADVLCEGERLVAADVLCEGERPVAAGVTDSS